MSDEDFFVYWATCKLGKPVGFIAYEGTPENWNVLNHIVSMTPFSPPEIDLKIALTDESGKEHNVSTDVSNLRKLVFTHPCGSTCEQVVCVDGWSWSEEINICVRYGTDSPEHKEFIEAQGA
jgi:hypothetical protein